MPTHPVLSRQLNSLQQKIAMTQEPHREVSSAVEDEHCCGSSERWDNWSSSKTETAFLDRRCAGRSDLRCHASFGPRPLHRHGVCPVERAKPSRKGPHLARDAHKSFTWPRYARWES